MIPQFYPDAYTSGRSFPYYAETPFDVLKWSQTATHDAFRDPDWSAILASYPDWQLAGVLPWNLGLGLRLSTPERRCVRRDIFKLTR